MQNILSNPFLLTNGSATGSPVMWPGGVGVFKAAGTFSGATVKLQYLGADEVTWCDAGTDTTLTASGGGSFILDTCPIKVTISGGPPSGIYATARKVGE